MNARHYSLVLIAIPLSIMAQPDTTRASEDRMQALEMSVSNGEGLNVKMTDGDTVTNKGSFFIDTKYKRITITTVPKPWANSGDSIAVVMKDLRTERRNRFTYWSGLDLGVNTLIDESGSTDLSGNEEFMEVDNSRSRFFAINFMEQKIEFGSHRVGLLTGLGWEFVNYRLKNNYAVQQNADSVFGILVDDPDYRKNKMRQIGLRVPLMFEFNTKRSPLPTEEDLYAMRRDTTGAIAKRFEHSRKHNFHIALGMVGSWYYNTMYKVKYEQEGETQKDRSSSDYYMLPYRAAAAVRIGYGGLNLFAEYSLTPLFENGKGPELTPLTVGLTIVGFN